MNSYDDLTPSNKRKLTRLINKLDDQRYATYRLQWEAYRAKADALYEEQHAHRAKIKSQAQEQTDILREQIEAINIQIDAINSQATDELRALNTAHREACSPEFQEYDKAQALATEWYKVERTKAVEEFYKDVEVNA